MLLYVLAFTDERPRPAPAAARFTLVNVEGIIAVCERRTARPPLTDAALRRQHRAVVDIARRTPAVLPVRFGALVAKRELTAAVRAHRQTLSRALDEVRGRVQMTLRILGAAPPAPAPATSGRQYLETRRRVLDPPLPESVERLLAAVRPLTAAERREPGAAGLLLTIYHLIAAEHAEAYLARTRGAAPRIVATGPWPPFAFTPQLW